MFSVFYLPSDKLDLDKHDFSSYDEALSYVHSRMCDGCKAKVLSGDIWPACACEYDISLTDECLQLKADSEEMYNKKCDLAGLIWDDEKENEVDHANLLHQVWIAKSMEELEPIKFLINSWGSTTV